MLLSVIRFTARIAILIAAIFLFDSCDFSGDLHETQDSLSLADQNYDVLKDPQLFTVREELGAESVTIFGKTTSLKSLLSGFYTPDTFTNSDTENSAADYIITGAELIQGTFLSDSGTCEQRTLLLCTRGDFVDEEYYDLFFLARDSEGNVMVSGREIFEGSHGANATELEVDELNLPVSKDCSVLMVTSNDENGDPDFHKESWVEIFMATGKGFRSLFRLQLEETSIDEYVASEDESQRAVSKIQKYEILDSSSNGLHDIRVTYTVTENGSTVKRGADVYQFDGRYYAMRTGD